MAKQTFTTGQVLTAAQMTSLQQTAMGGGSTTAKTGSYTLVAADAGTVVQMNSASATTITVNTALFAAGDTVQIQNIGAGVCTITAGTATVSTSSTLSLQQYNGGMLFFNTTSAAFYFAAGGTGSILMAYATVNTSLSVSAGVETISITSPSFTAVAGRLYKITYYEPQLPLTQNANATTAAIRLTNTSGTKYQTSVANNASATAGFVENTHLVTITTLTAGSTVIVGTLNFAGLGQTAVRGSGQLAVLIIQDIGV